MSSPPPPRPTPPTPPSQLPTTAPSPTPGSDLIPTLTALLGTHTTLNALLPTLLTLATTLSQATNSVTTEHVGYVEGLLSRSKQLEEENSKLLERERVAKGEVEGLTHTNAALTTRAASLSDSLSTLTRERDLVVGELSKVTAESRATENSLEGTVRGLRDDVAVATNHIAMEKEKSAKLEGVVRRLHAENAALTDSMSSLNAENVGNMNRVKTVENVCAVLRGNVEESEQVNKDLSKRCETLLEAVVTAKNEVEAEREKCLVEKDKHDLSLGGYESTIDALNAQVAQVTASLDSQSATVTSQAQRIAALTTEASTAVSTIAEHTTVVKLLEFHVAQGQARLNEVAAEYEQFRHTVAGETEVLKRAVASTTQQLEATAEELHGANKTITAMKVNETTWASDKENLIVDCNQKQARLVSLEKEVNTLSTTASTTRASSAQLSTANADLTLRNKKLQQEIAAEQAQTADTTARYQDMSVFYMAAKQQVNEKESESNELRKDYAEKMVQYSQKIARTEATLGQAENEVRLKTTEFDQITSLLDAATASIDALTAANLKLASQVTNQSSVESLWSLQKESYDAKIAASSTVVKKLKTDYNTVLDKYRKLKTASEVSSGELKAVRMERDGEGKRNDELTSEVSTLGAKMKNGEEEVATLQLALKERDVSVEELANQVDQKTSEIASLKEKVGMVRQMEDELGIKDEKTSELATDLESARSDFDKVKKEFDECRSQWDLAQIQNRSLEERLEAVMGREEEARAALLRCENRGDALADENRKMKGWRGEEGRRVEDIAKMMAEVEGKAAEGVRVREEEIERLMKRCEVLGEAVRRYSGGGEEGGRKEAETVVEDVVTPERCSLEQENTEVDEHQHWFNQQMKNRPALNDISEFSEVNATAANAVLVTPGKMPEKIRKTVGEKRRTKKKTAAAAT